MSDKVPKDMLKPTMQKAQSRRPNKPPKLQRSTSKPVKPKSAANVPKKSADTTRQRPVDPQVQKAVAKAMQSKSAPRKKRRYRGGNYILYYILAAIIVAVVMIILANTVLFKCGEIEVLGNVRYSAEEIAARSGLNLGDNLLHVNTAAAEERIVESLAYVDKVQVKKSFPTKFVITVTEAEKWFALSQNGVTAAISRMGKILEQGNTDGLTVVKGYEAESIETGKWLKSKIEGKSEIPQLVFDAAEKAGLENIDEIDMTDKFAVKLSVDGGRITLELGPATEVESKLRVAEAFIKNELGAEESVTVLLSNPEKFAVRNKPKPPSSSSSSSTSVPPEISEPAANETGETGETSEPTYEEPTYEEPTYEEPTYDEPTYEEPTYEEPTYEEPTYVEPNTTEEPSETGGTGEAI